MKTLGLTLSLIVAIALLPANVQAQAATSVADFTKCRQIEDPTARLACYDQDAVEIVEAQEKGELLIIDKEKADEIKKDNFGFKMPSLPKFQLPKRDNEPDERYTIMTIEKYKVKANGLYTFFLSNGQTWQQTDGHVNRAPKGAGQTLHVREAALGSYLARLNGVGAGLRVKRIK